MSKLLLTFLMMVFAATARDRSDKISIYVAGIDVAAPVKESLARQLSESKLFQVVGLNDANSIAVLVHCIDRKRSDDPFLCMYTSHLNGMTSKSMLGGGIYATGGAEEMATGILGAIAEDVVERFNDTTKTNLKETLKACLLLTDSKCNVPDGLQVEMNAKQITLGQYLLKQQ